MFANPVKSMLWFLEKKKIFTLSKTPIALTPLARARTCYTMHIELGKKKIRSPAQILHKSTMVWWWLHPCF